MTDEELSCVIGGHNEMALVTLKALELKFREYCKEGNQNSKLI